MVIRALAKLGKKIMGKAAPKKPGHAKDHHDGPTFHKTEATSKSQPAADTVFTPGAGKKLDDRRQAPRRDHRDDQAPHGEGQRSRGPRRPHHSEPHPAGGTAGSLKTDRQASAVPSETPSAHPHQSRGPRRDGGRGERRDGRAGGRSRDRGAHEGQSRRPRRESNGPRDHGSTPVFNPDPYPLVAAHVGWDPSSFTVEPREGSTRFQDLGIASELLHAIADLGFQYCTPIQAQVLPATLQGRDAAGRAQTGTGKTAAFLLTIYNHLLTRKPGRAGHMGKPRVLILAPTRELVLQIEKEACQFGKYTGIQIMPVFGGMDYDKQRKMLEATPMDILVATPGRLIDFRRRNVIDLSAVEILVIDEADRMLDMGFIPDVKEIVYSTPPKHQRQTLLFSATLTPDVIRLASAWTTNQHLVEIEPTQVAVDSVEQRVYITTTEEKFTLLYNILKKAAGRPVMVFGNRRDITQDLSDKVAAYGFKSALLSGAVNQMRRVKVLEQFKGGEINVLVATDVAGRGIHVDGVAYVVNYNLPQDPEDYVHRIGRTGRAGASGISVSFACEEDSFAIPVLEEFLKTPLKCTFPEEELLVSPPELPADHPFHKQVPSHDAERHRSGGRPRGGGFRGGRPGGRPGGRGGPRGGGRPRR